MGYIYKIKNKIDNKTYIGQTTQDLESRWRNHRKNSSKCRYLKSAFKKYGVENFEFKLVCITFDNQLDDMEIKYIEQYKCLVPNGYNIRLGGNSGKHHDETKRKIAATLLKNRKVIQFDIEGNRLKSFYCLREAAEYIGCTPSSIGHCCNDDIKTTAGFRWKYESNETTSELGIPPLTGRFKSSQPTTKRRKIITQIPRKIIQFDIQGNRLNSFATCREAAEYVGASRGFITTCCLKPTQTGKGFYWKYESMNSSDTNSEGQDEIYKQIASKKNRKVIQFDIQGNRLKSFDTCKQAADYVGTSNGCISRCCNGVSNTSKGYVWKYESIL